MRILPLFLRVMVCMSILVLFCTPRLWGAVVTLSTTKDNSVYSGAPTTNTGAATLLDASTSDMSYMLFDLNAIAIAESVPANQIQLISSTLMAIDLRTSNNGINVLYLADVSGSWDENTFDWNGAVAGYGAVGGAGTADLDPTKELWEGRLSFSANTVVDVTAVSEAPYTDTGLLNALQADLSTGDGQVVFIMRGQSGSNRYTASKENGSALPPRLVIEYSVIPEPSATLLALIASISAAGRHRVKRWK